LPITTTTSPDDALALIAMYSIFELCCDKNSRSMRFLYGVMFSDKRFLSNSIRSLLADKQINIYAERKYMSYVSSNPFISKEATVDVVSTINS